MYKVARETFERLVSAAVADLPDNFRSRVNNVEFAVEDTARDSDFAGFAVRGQTLLGVYRGSPLPRRGRGYNMAFPERIVIFQQPLRRLSREADDLAARGGPVGRHEIARPLGSIEECGRGIATCRGGGCGTIYARDFGDDILEVMAQCPRICRYLHLPVQSGSDRILKLMNRGYTLQEYLGLVDRARRILPDVCLAGDIIVGFPTETDEDFERTKALLRRLRFKNTFNFKAAPRPGTAAMSRLPDD